MEFDDQQVVGGLVPPVFAICRRIFDGNEELPLALALEQATSKAEEHCMIKPREPNGVEPQFSEDDIQRQEFGPRGVPGAPDPVKMTPQREKKQPKDVDPGHTA